MVSLNMRAGLTRVRMMQAFRETSHHFAGTVATFATAAFMCGRAYGREEAGQPVVGGPHNPAARPKS